MAKIRESKEEHAFKKIKKDIKDNDLGGLLFFHGEEEYLAKWAKEEIIDSFLNPAFKEINCSVLNWQKTTMSQIIDLCETIPMLDHKRILVLEEFNISGAGEEGDDSHEDISGSDDKKMLELADYVQNLPEYCIVMLISKTADKRKKIYKTIAGIGKCYEFNRLNEEDLRSFVRKRIRQAGKNPDAMLIRKIIEISGYFDKESNYTLFNLDNDMKKLIDYSGNDNIRAEDLASVLSKNTEAYVFDMIDAISNNKKGEALTLLHSLLYSGEPWQKLLALICSSYEFIFMVKEMKEEGYALHDIKNQTKAHEYRIKIASQISGRFSLEQLRKTLCSCFDVDKNVKSGLMDEKLALELLIAGA